jgi:tetratricopeptide (TPR) repeat protein
MAAMVDENRILFSEYTVWDLLQLGLTALNSKNIRQAHVMLFEVCERFRCSGECVPPIALSLYSLALAHQNRMTEAIDTCRLALKGDPQNPTTRLHMARIYLLANSRRRAFDEFQKGLLLSPESPDLLALQKEFGVRRKPVIGFLSRENPVNAKLGRMRTQLKKIAGAVAA